MNEKMEKTINGMINEEGNLIISLVEEETGDFITDVKLTKTDIILFVESRHLNNDNIDEDIVYLAIQESLIEALKNLIEESKKQEKI